MPAADALLSFSDMTAPSWDFRRGPAAARILVELAADHGVRAPESLAGTGLGERDLHDPDTQIEALQELAIARNLIRQIGDRPGLGVEAGCRYTLGSLGVWGFALMTSPTVRDLLRLGTHYAALSFAFIHPVYDETAGRARVVLEDEEIPEDVRDFFVERELAKLATLMPVVLGPFDGIAFETRFDGARAAPLAAAIPGLRAGRPSHALSVPAALLAYPLPQADRDAARALEEQCRELMDRRRRLTGVASRVRAQLLARPGELIDMAALAKEMAIDERTLRRHLAAEGTSFRAIADDVRAALAHELLTTARLTVEETARHLGYHDAAGFSRAFRRWTGTTPGALRGSAGPMRGSRVPA
jgi:AraC-like DNA-binding protein